ncbi:hypothetical protein [Ornithinibacillus halophilus]|uniref:Uncharacterized protein n=1 Tax=Ornithinibacillus halophilus TaxID=930117 RepID=A0A1M5MBT1_9BACI|nr:hypothetical protein [Ornithinibacillus halophilus]SHG74183.1 hypothetical protein SAMN05216225_10564 [Ornithinibacillus halophilus]
MRYLTDEEINLASRFLFLSMALIVIKQDMEQIKNGAFKIKEPYIKLLENMNSEALLERRRLRKEMEDKAIQVVLLNKNDSFSSYLFTCKGREEQRNYFNPAIRKKVEAIVRELMHKVSTSEPPSAVANT